MPNRHYRVIRYGKGNAQYLQLIVQFPDRPGVWHTNAVRSYGQATPQAEAQAQSDLSELQSYASDPSAPMPAGVVDDVIWRNFQRYSQTGLPSPFNPAGVLEALQGAAGDLAHLAGWVISDAVGDIATKVSITQPDMDESERQRFIQWLGGFPPDVQRRLLAYQWHFR